MTAMARLETSRLWLRPVERGDVAGLVDLFNEPTVRRYLWDDEVVAEATVVQVVERSSSSAVESGYGIWLYGPKGDPRFVGFTGFHPFHDPPQLELIYGQAPTVCGRGFATEAAQAVIDHGFEVLGMARIQMSTDVPNRASVAVMERLGARFRKRTEDGLAGTLFYEIHRPDRG